MWTAALALCLSQELAFRWNADIEDRFWQALHVLEVEDQPLAAATMLEELVAEPGVTQDPGQTGYVLAQRYRALRLAERHEEARVLLPRLRQAVSGTDFAAPAERLIVQADRMSASGLQVDEALMQLLLEAIGQGSDSLESLLAGYGDRLTPEVLRVLDRPAAFTDRLADMHNPMARLWTAVWRAGSATVLAETSARIENRDEAYLKEIRFTVPLLEGGQFGASHRDFVLRLSKDARASIAALAIPSLVAHVGDAAIHARVTEILSEEQLIAPFLLETLVTRAADSQEDRQVYSALVLPVLSRPNGLRQTARNLTLRKGASILLQHLAVEHDDEDAIQALLVSMMSLGSTTINVDGERVSLGAFDKSWEPIFAWAELRTESWPDLADWRAGLIDHSSAEVRRLALLSCLYDANNHHSSAADFLAAGIELDDLVVHVYLNSIEDSEIIAEIDGTIDSRAEEIVLFNWVGRGSKQLSLALAHISLGHWVKLIDEHESRRERVKSQVRHIKAAHLRAPETREALWSILEHNTLGELLSGYRPIEKLIETLDRVDDPIAEFSRIVELACDGQLSQKGTVDQLTNIFSQCQHEKWKLDSEVWHAAMSLLVPRLFQLQYEQPKSADSMPNESRIDFHRLVSQLATQAAQLEVEVEFLWNLIATHDGIAKGIAESALFERAVQDGASFPHLVPIVYEKIQHPKSWYKLSAWRGQDGRTSARWLPAKSAQAILESSLDYAIEEFWEALTLGRLVVKPSLDEDYLTSKAQRDVQYTHRAAFALDYLNQVNFDGDEWAKLAKQTWDAPEFEDHEVLVRAIGERYEPGLVSILLEAQVSLDQDVAKAADEALARYSRIRASRGTWEAWQRQGREGSPIDSLVERTAATKPLKVRLAAIQALGTLEAKDALPFLVELLEDSEQAVVDAAEKAMARIHRASTEPVED